MSEGVRRSFELNLGRRSTQKKRIKKDNEGQALSGFVRSRFILGISGIRKGILRVPDTGPHTLRSPHFELSKSLRSPRALRLDLSFQR
jgi:hypothetical protein